MDDELREALQVGAGRLRQLAVSRGMRTLRDDGVRQVRAGVTTSDEVLRVTRS
jgi:general secretion pathway protein E